MMLPDATAEEIRAHLHDRRFVTAGNPHGVSGSETVFHYLVDGTAIWGSYKGGQIREGSLVGCVKAANRIELLYHCLTTDGELLAGWSRGQVSVNREGRTTLAFEWGWLSGAEGGGESHYVEMAPVAQEATAVTAAAEPSVAADVGPR